MKDHCPQNNLKTAPEFEGGRLSSSHFSGMLDLIVDVTQIGLLDWDLTTGRVIYSKQWEAIAGYEQPHVRPIKRGKAGCETEFGQKLALAVVDGFTFIEEQSWDNFSEGATLIDSARRYRERHGCYPEAILADKAYRTRNNLDFCKQHGIRLSGPRLGRLKKEEIEQNRQQAYQDSCDRNIVEGRKGVVKRRFGLDLVMAYLADWVCPRKCVSVNLRVDDGCRRLAVGGRA